MLFILALFLFVSPASAQSSYPCGTRSVPDVNVWNNCVSPAYNPATTLLDGAPSTADPYSRYQWGMRQILEGEQYTSLFDDAPRDVIVAVIDDHVGLHNHPDLVNVYLPGINTVEGGTNTDAVWDGKAATSTNEHGQCVASIIAAEHNDIGMAGVFHRAKILPIRASLRTVPAAIDAAVAAGADVIHIAGMAGEHDQFVQPPLDPWWQLNGLWPAYNIENFQASPARYMSRTEASSIHENGLLRSFAAAIERAVWDHDVIVTTIVANWDGKVTLMFHADLHETVVALASNVRGEPSPFNSLSHSSTITAPGGDRRNKLFPSMPVPSDVIVDGHFSNQDDVLCAVGPNKYSYGSGTSFSGPLLAGAAAIIKSYLPDATAQDVRRLMRNSAQPFQMVNLTPAMSLPGMLSLKRLREAIAAEM